MSESAQAPRETPMSARDRAIVAAFFRGRPPARLARDYRLTRQRIHKIISDFRDRTGLSILPGLVVTPCAGEGCGRLVACASASPPVFCHVCTDELMFKKGA